MKATGSAALSASVPTPTGAPGDPGTLTRSTSVPLIQATNPSSTSAPILKAATSDGWATTKDRLRKIDPYTFCIPEIRVPPGRASPNQKGAGADANWTSRKSAVRQAVTGAEASLVPGRQRQTEPGGTSVWACRDGVAGAGPVARAIPTSHRNLRGPQGPGSWSGEPRGGSAALFPGSWAKDRAIPDDQQGAGWIR